MASTPSTSLRLELMATGDQSGTWGDTTNTNLGTLLEQAITGVLSVAQGDVANLTLTNTDYVSNQARNAVVNLTGAMTSGRNVVVPTANKLYLIKNSTTGGFAVTVKTAAGTGVAVPAGTARWVYCDGTNVVDGLGYAWSATATALRPDASDGMALGTTTLMWSDLFLATGAVINWNNGNVTLTQSANALAFAGVTGGVTFDGALSASSTAAGTLLTATSTDAGAASGPDRELYRNSASPAASDVLGRDLRYGKDSAGNKQLYAGDKVTIVDATSTSEDATWEFNVTVGGAETRFFGLAELASGTADPNAVGLPLGQLSFPGVQNPSSNANTLDDYEENIFVPGMTFGGSSTGITYSLQVGSYVKVGQIVWFAGHITLTNNGSGTGAALITGLPFTSESASAVGSFNIPLYANFSGINNAPMGYVNVSATTIGLTQGAATASVNLTDTNITNTADFYFSGVYRAAA